MIASAGSLCESDRNRPDLGVKAIDPKTDASRTKVPSDTSVLPPLAMMWVVEALRNGAIDKGYGVRNWRHGAKVRNLNYVDAFRRHIDRYDEGEDVAGDSLIHHLAHLAAGAIILLDAHLTGQVVDDRVHGRAALMDREREAILNARRRRAEAETVNVR